MIEVKRVFPECHSDTLLVQLILQRGNPMHIHGISNVARELVRYPLNDFVIGLVDSDKFKRDNENKNILAFTEKIEDKKESEGIIVFKIPNSNKHLIRIHPKFEPWMWDVATKCGIDPNDDEYKFSSYQKFYDSSKRSNAAEDREFKKFINAVVRKNPPPIQTLKTWLEKVFEN